MELYLLRKLDVFGPVSSDKYNNKNVKILDYTILSQGNARLNSYCIQSIQLC